MISVQREDFNLQTEYEALQRAGESGAIVTFTGLVRDFPGSEFRLEHYPGMTEKVLQRIDADARARWPLSATRIIHRIGALNAGDQIVFVGVSSRHRKSAFDACQFIIDILKTQAPFWKKEGDSWVEAQDSDSAAADKWLTTPNTN